MSFGENVGYYRKELKITQEELADRLFVSRQTVSRWETDSTFPDVEMLVRLCDLFGCDMDTLVRGDAKSQMKDDAPDREATLDRYDKHMSRFALFISLGVAFVLFGVAMLMLILALGGGEVLGVVALLGCVTVSVADFIATGIIHSNFMRENPRMFDYPEERRKRFSRKMPLLITAATVIVLLGVIMLILMCGKEGYAPSGFTVPAWELFSATLFMLLIAVSVFIYVYTGITYSKYDVKEYNKSCVKEGYAEDTSNEEERKREKLSERISSVIMMTATVTFLLCGAIGGFWHPAWVAFPVGGILCGIVSVILESKNKKG